MASLWTRGYLINPAKMGRRVAIKFCGGCNPGFDRVQYFNRIRAAAGDSYRVGHSG